MPLTSDQKLIAKEVGSKLFYYCCEGEKHGAVLRQDVNAYGAALEEYNKRNPAAYGSVPAPEDLDKCVADCEKALSQPCKDLVDHVQAFSAALLLARVLTQKLPWEVYMLSLEFQTKLMEANPIVIDPATLLGVQPGTLHPLLAAEFTRPASEPRRMGPDTAVRYPAVLVADEAEVFSWDAVPSASQRVSPPQITVWKMNPESLLDQIFVAMVDDSKEAFKLLSFMTVRKTRVFYVLFVDEKDACGYSSDAFFELLEVAELRIPA